MELQPHPNPMFQQLAPHQQQSDLHLHQQQQQPQQQPPHPQQQQQQQQPQHHASHFMPPQQKLPQQSHPGQMNGQLTYQQLQHLQSQQGIRPQQPLRSERPEDHPDSIVFPGHSGTRQAPFNLMLHGATHVASPFPSEQFAAQQHTQQASAMQQMQQLRFRPQSQDQFAILQQQQQERARLNSQPNDVHGTPFPPTQNGFSPPGPPQQPQQGPRTVPAQQQSVPGVRRIPSQQQIGAGPPTAPFSGNGLAVGSGSGMAVSVNATNGGMMASSGMQMDVGQAQNGGGVVFSRPISSIPPMGNGIRMQQVQSSEGMVAASPFGRAPSARQMTPQMMDMTPGQNGRSTVGIPMYGSQQSGSTPSMQPPPQQTPFQGPSALPNSFSRGPSGSPHQGSPHSQPYSTPTNVPTSTPRISSATNTPIHRGAQPPPNPNPQTFYPPAPPQGTGVVPQSGSGPGPVQGDPTRSQTSTPGSFPPQLTDSRDSLQVQMYAQQSQPHIHPHQMGQQPQSLQQLQQSQSQQLPHQQQLQQSIQQSAPPRDVRQSFQPNEMQARQRAQQLQQQAQQQHPLQQQQTVQQIGAPDAPSMGFARTPSLQPSLPYPPSSQMQHQQPSTQAQQPPGHHLSPTEPQGIFPYRPPLFSEDTISGSTTSGGSIHSQSQSPHSASFPPISGTNVHSSPGSGMIPSVQALGQGHFGLRRMPTGSMPPPGSEQNQSTTSAALPQSRMSIPQHHPGMLGVGSSQTPLYARPSEVQMRMTPNNLVGSGQGVLRLMEFSHALSGGYMKTSDYWKGVATEFFSQVAGSIQMTLWKDTEAKPFSITENNFPRFFFTSYNSGVKSITLTLNGVTEHVIAAGEGRVDCQEASWMFTFDTGYVITLRGPLHAIIHVVPAINPLPSPAPAHSLKFQRMAFSSNKLEKHIDLDAVIGVRKPGPPMNRRPHLANSMNGSTTIPSPTLPAGAPYPPGDPRAETLWIMIDNARLPADPVNAFGIPEATMRSLEFTETFTPLDELIQMSIDRDLGPREALRRAAEIAHEEHPELAAVRRENNNSNNTNPNGRAETSDPLPISDYRHPFQSVTATSTSTTSPHNPHATPKISHPNTPGANVRMSPMQTERPGTGNASQRQSSSLNSAIPSPKPAQQAAPNSSASSSSTVQSPSTLVSSTGSKRKATIVDGVFDGPSSNPDPPAPATGRRSRTSAAAAAAAAEQTSPIEGPAHATRATRQRKASPPSKPTASTRNTRRRG